MMISLARSFDRLVSSLLGLGIICMTVNVWGADTKSSADETWKELLSAQEKFEGANPTSLKKYAERAGQLADRFKDYQTQYPASTNLSEAWENWMDLLNVAAEGSSARRSELETAEQQCLAHPQLNRAQRKQIYNNQVNRVGDIAERERLVRKLKAENKVFVDFFCQHMLDIAEFAESPHARELVDEVLKLTEVAPTIEQYYATGRTNTNEAFVNAWKSGEKAIRGMHHKKALELKQQLERIGQPLPLRFTALDGTKVDLEQYRGKVVLLDFWATWCPPCVAGLPRVKSVWEKLHKEGFEVIGMSYDEERKELENFLKKTVLPWPQFFDPAGREAPLIKSLGQPGPPAYWLIGRDGLVVDLNAHDNLEKKVRRLLDVKVEKPKPGSVK